MASEFQTYLFQYYHDGAWWAFEIQATSLEDANERVAKLPHAQYQGELAAKVPAGVGLGWAVRLWCWWKNGGLPS